MRLADIDAFLYETTSRVGATTRNLSLAGIGIVWVFKVEQNGSSYLPRDLVLPALFFVISIALDFFQYAYNAIAFGIVARLNRDKNGDTDISLPSKITLPAFCMFYGKILSAVVGYVLLLNLIVTRFTISR